MDDFVLLCTMQSGVQDLLNTAAEVVQLLNLIFNVLKSKFFVDSREGAICTVFNGKVWDEADT